MSFKEKVENFTYTNKLNGNRVSSLNYIRENFDEIQKLILAMKNQGQGSAYAKIAEFCFEDGIKTKNGEKLSIEYINDCLIKIRKEKGISVRSNSTPKTFKNKEKEIEKTKLNDELYNWGRSELKRVFEKAFKLFTENNLQKFTPENIKTIKLYYKLTTSIQFDNAKLFRKELIPFYEAHPEIIY